MSLTLTSHSGLSAKVSEQQGNPTVSLFFLLVLLLSLGTIAGDQFAAPTLYSSSPLWALAVCAILVWRRGRPKLEAAAEGAYAFSAHRIAAFAAGHILLVTAAILLRGTLEPVAGAVSKAGWIWAALKLTPLLPTVFLLPLRRWQTVLRVYRPECLAGGIVLFTFFPGRILEAAWPWYGQVLGKFALFVAGLFVPGFTYTSSLFPTIHGPDLDVTILLACSGISGLELFDYLFAFVAILDWNGLRKGRTAAAYFVGLGVMLLSNALRITSLVVLGNRGFAEAVARFHLSAGWLFFSAVFLCYLASVYRLLLVKPEQTQAAA